MVDINLIGDDQTQFEPEENEKDFQDAYSGESEDFSQDSFMRSDTFDTSDYSNVIKKGGSKAGVIILFIIVLGLLAATAYVLFKPAKTQKIASLDSEIQPGDIEAVPVEDTAMTPVQSPDLGAETATTQPPASSNLSASIPATVLDLITKSYTGFRSINQLVNSIPPSINFTMITYSDGKVLFELLSEDETAISDIDAILRQKIPTAKLTTVSRGVKPIKGRQFYQALLKGELSTAYNSSVSSAPRYLTSDEMTQLMNRLAEQNRVRVLEINRGVNKMENGVPMTPVTIRIRGLKSNLLNTMKSILDENVNISFVKISLIAKEMEVGNPQMTLVLNVNLFQAA